jgi:hypothetical protein
MSAYKIETYIQESSGKKGISYRTSIGSVNSSQRDYFHTTKDTIVAQIHPHVAKLCNSYVDAGYIRNSIHENTIIVTLKKSDGTVSGFITSSPTQDGGHYLDVICATEKGRELLSHYMHLLESLNSKYVQLSALPKVLSYYPQFGFQHRMRCDSDNELLEMPKEVIAFIKQEKPTEKELYKNRLFMKFLNTLRKFGYTVKDSEVCQDPNTRLKTFMKEGCTDQGFTMRKCFRSTPDIRQTRAITRRRAKKQTAIHRLTAKQTGKRFQK